MFGVSSGVTCEALNWESGAQPTEAGRGACGGGERNLTIGTVLTVSRGLGITMSELLSGMESLVTPISDASAERRR